MLIDISKNIDKNVAVYPGDPAYKIEKVCTLQNEGYEVSKITLGSHFSTHIDSPRHFYADGKDIASEPLDVFCGMAKVINVTEINSDFVKNIMSDKFEILLFKTKNKNFGLSCNAAKVISASHIKMCGTENDDIESCLNKDFPVHRILLAKNILILENIDLKNVPEGIYKLYCFPLKITGCDASPVRAVLEV
ncbi:MAG: cyclase family protein [Clostridia bacterium]|jgi:arylformamidase|nr:cyclase family protein [Clostridia bacterium]